LTPRQTKGIEARLDGMGSYEEIAEHLGIKVKAVDNASRKAFNTLRSIVAADEQVLVGGDSRAENVL
jgi:DNA-directed RNA polymerase specialized sigma24 family protein